MTQAKSVAAQSAATSPRLAMANWHPGPWPVPQELAGAATIAPNAPVEAGSWASFVVTYTAGKFRIDDSVSLKICFLLCIDMNQAQFCDPHAPCYTTASASYSPDPSD